jgi:hypothetical protein
MVACGFELSDFCMCEGGQGLASTDLVDSDCEVLH